MSRKDRASLEALQRLEPCDGKLSCTVPRRAAAGNSGGLSGKNLNVTATALVNGGNQKFVCTCKQKNFHNIVKAEFKKQSKNMHTQTKKSENFMLISTDIEFATARCMEHCSSYAGGGEMVRCVLFDGQNHMQKGFY